MTGRLLVLVLLPVSALTVVSLPGVARTRHDADRAQAVQRLVPAVTTTISALAAVEAEQGAAESVLLSLQSGVQVAVASAALGVDLEAELRSARVVTDRALVTLPSTLGPSVVTQMVALRASMDVQAASTSVVEEQFQRVETLLEKSSASTLAEIDKAVVSTSEGRALSQALLTLGWCSDLVRAAASQTADSSGVWFAPSGDRQQAAITLASDTALFAEAGRRIAQSAIPAVAASWAALAADPLVVNYGAFIVKAVHGIALPLADGKIQTQAAPGTINIADLGGVVRGNGARWQLIATVVVRASGATQDAARTLARANTRTYQLGLMLLIGAALAAVVVALLIARSISRPLGRLAETARSVVGGDLGVDRLIPRGPRQTVVVADAFNALVDNLRLMESKAQALAAGAFDDPVFAVPLPGRLGQSMEDSVQVLSGSVQDRRDLQERLAYQATHDPLTGLLNRPAALGALDQALARARRGRDTTALLYIDLDRFQQINTLYGRPGGDHVLREVGARLSGAVEGGEIVARLTGNQFLVVAERAGDPAGLGVLAAHLVDQIAKPVDWAEHHLTIGASIGITSTQGDDGGALELLGRAELALHQAKRRGRGRTAVYDEALEQDLAEHDAIERDLGDALARGGAGLVLYYQPVVSAMTTGLIAVEALIRWDRPGDGLLVPDRFIPVAETSDLIIDLDNWVLGAAARQMVAWSADPAMAAVRVSVNVSGRHLLSQHLPEHLQRVLAASAADPALLTIEITETVLLDDLAAAAAALAQIRALGVRIAVDDFGTGYTSLSHLQDLPVDTIKIDRSFVVKLDRSNDTSLLQMMIELGHRLGLKIVTEGVETTRQFDTLRELGSDTIQGYLFGRPMLPEALSEWLRARGPGAGAAPGPAHGNGRRGGRGNGRPAKPPAAAATTNTT